MQGAIGAAIAIRSGRWTTEYDGLAAVYCVVCISIERVVRARPFVSQLCALVEEVSAAKAAATNSGILIVFMSSNSFSVDVEPCCC